MSYDDVATSGHEVRWVEWSGEHPQQLHLRWENQGWVAEGVVGRERVHYVLRLNASWRVSQFLLFRDLAEPDLWLGTDGSGRWGEVNGAHRPDLDGCTDLALPVTPFTHSLPIRRLPLADGECAQITVASVDVETLQLRREHCTYTRRDHSRWVCERESGSVQELTVDQFGLVVEVAQAWRRVGNATA